MKSTLIQPTISRRGFIKNLSLTGLAMTTPMHGAFAQSNRVNSIGLQLYSLRKEMAVDFEGTLAKLAEIGFKEMEFAGYFDKTPHEVRAVLDANGLSSPAAHIPLTDIANNLNQVIDTAATIGQKYIVLPFMIGKDREIDNYPRIAELLNRSGEVAKAAGLKMGYHNHDFEFDMQEGKRGYDILLAETDPDLVFFEMDLFWSATAGVDATEYFRNNPGRFPMLHVKDKAADGTMVDVGRGTIDFAAIFSLASVAGFEHYFIEHDNPSDGINSVTYSYNNVNQIRF